jgi:hypothetical protein
MTREAFAAIALAFPGVEQGLSYGQPAFKANGKFLTRIRSEDESAVFLEVSFDERELLMEAEPQTFHITPHYKDYPSVLARLASLDPGSARAFIERRWRKVMPRKLVKAWEAEQA